MARKIKKLIKTGFALGAGSIGLGAIGATQAQQGVTNISAALPAVGSIVGVGLVLGSTRRLIDTVSPRSRRSRRMRL